jgi:hypothetical protein
MEPHFVHESIHQSRSNTVRCSVCVHWVFLWMLHSLLSVYCFCFDLQSIFVFVLLFMFLEFMFLDLTDVVLISHLSRFPFVSRVRLWCCFLRFSFMFLALLIVPQVAAKQIEGCDFFSLYFVYIYIYIYNIVVYLCYGYTFMFIPQWLLCNWFIRK